MNSERLKKEFVSKYKKDGADKFYKFLMFYAVNKLMAINEGKYNGKSPELEFMDYYERLIILYRVEGEAIYFDLAKLFRKAAHKIYRIMLKKDMTSPNVRFLNLV